MQTTYLTDISYIVSLVSIKTSILLLYLQILSALFLRRLCWIMLVFISIMSVYSLVSFILMCIPVEAFWDPMNHPGAWCFPGALKYYVDISVHLLGEIIILLLPMPFLLSLQLPLRRKLGYIMLFALGIMWVPTVSCPMLFLHLTSQTNPPFPESSSYPLPAFPA